MRKHLPDIKRNNNYCLPVHKAGNVIVFIFLLSCSACNYWFAGRMNHMKEPEFFLDNDAINTLNEDNIIYEPGATYVYNVAFFDKNGHRQFSYVKYNPACRSDRKISCNTWVLADSTDTPPQYGIRIDKIFLTVYHSKGHSSLSNSQTIIKYDYYNSKKGKILIGEITGVIEDSAMIFLHPPRQHSLIMTEFSPFPIVKIPLYIGKEWSGAIDIPENMVKKAFPDASASMYFSSNYKVTDSTSIDQPFARHIPCHIITAHNTGNAGNSELQFHFNPEYGFIRMKYVNIDDTQIQFTLENMYASRQKNTTRQPLNKGNI